MLRALWNWLKSVFYTLFPCALPDSSWREVEPLLLPDPVPAESAALPDSDSNTEQEQSSSQLIVSELNKRSSLTAEESALVIHHAQRGENDYIDNLPIEKQDKAHQLITSFVKYNINQVNQYMKRLVQLNAAANRLETSWRRVRADFITGDPSEYNITPICENFREKHIADFKTASGRLQNTLLDKIIESFNNCKKMLGLKIARRFYINTQKSYAPTKEESRQEFFRTESRMNMKTLELVNDFNNRIDEYENENPEPSRIERKGKLYGYSK